jgi:hypothetical protein
MRRSAHFLFAALMLAAPSVLAQSSGDKATAEALFGDGRRLMAQGNYKEACPKFEASLKLDPGVGAMLNLADCYEKNGQTASAWAEFREASAAARTAGAKDREDLARQRAAALDPKLSRLTIVVGKQSARVTRDGTAVDSAAFGTAMPVDPGKHVIEATAPGKKKWSTTVDVAANGARVSVDVPPLQDESQTGSVLPPGPPGPTKEVDVSTGSGSSTQRTLAIGAGVVGVAGLAVGTIFGLKAQSSWKDADGACATHVNCSQTAIDAGNDANSQATLSTVAFAVGILGIAGGAVLWFTAPKSTDGETKVSIGVSPTGVLLRGGF